MLFTYLVTIPLGIELRLLIPDVKERLSLPR
jgi:hypothetical protein